MAINENERTTIYQWGCLAALISGIVLIVFGGIWLFNKPPASPPGAIPTAIIQTVTLTVPSIAMPSPTPPANLVDGVGIGVRVQVNGTGTVGLSIRSDASTQAERRSIAEEGSIFLVTDGPKEAEGLIWWFIKDEADPNVVGWAAADYLLPVP